MDDLDRVVGEHGGAVERVVGSVLPGAPGTAVTERSLARVARARRGAGDDEELVRQAVARELRRACREEDVPVPTDDELALLWSRARAGGSSAAATTAQSVRARVASERRTRRLVVGGLAALTLGMGVWGGVRAIQGQDAAPRPTVSSPPRTSARPRPGPSPASPYDAALRLPLGRPISLTPRLELVGDQVRLVRPDRVDRLGATADGSGTPPWLDRLGPDGGISMILTSPPSPPADRPEDVTPGTASVWWWLGQDAPHELALGDVGGLVARPDGTAVAVSAADAPRPGAPARWRVRVLDARTAQQTASLDVPQGTTLVAWTDEGLLLGRPGPATPAAPPRDGGVIQPVTSWAWWQPQQPAARSVGGVTSSSFVADPRDPHRRLVRQDEDCARQVTSRDLFATGLPCLTADQQAGRGPGGRYRWQDTPGGGLQVMDTTTGQTRRYASGDQPMQAGGGIEVVGWEDDHTLLLHVVSGERGSQALLLRWDAADGAMERVAGHPVRLLPPEQTPPRR
ncbi:hypothetical protein [Arsenicicoccus dermatophilus]|uniref:hypothetical protein n=1 Tax=Arsenicicoccus dermatophilus TaxID=1076331 RepID=UPI001F4C641A|nr:hypothetical protein [Arsenicicoccus dermatophilus]MCH8611721.1 hypothetical protein [Arsenicicoccus dermatophilus]